MCKRIAIATRMPAELAAALGLSPLDAAEIEAHNELNDRIIQIVRPSGLTHAQVAKSVRTSRSRVTNILNRNTHEVSTDLLLRILAALAYRAHVTIRRARPAALMEERISASLGRWSTREGIKSHPSTPQEPEAAERQE